MPPPTMDIRMIKDVLRLKLHGKLSHEAVARCLSISKGVVAKYTSLASASVAWMAGRRSLVWVKPSWSGACLALGPSNAGWSSRTSGASVWSFGERVSHSR